MEKNTRRTVLKGSATGIATLVGVSGTTAAKSSNKKSFERVIKDWIADHGQIVDFEIKNKKSPRTRVLTYEFEDGTTKIVLEKFTNNQLVHKVDGKTYKESLKELQQQAQEIRKKRNAKGPTETTQESTTDFTTQSVPTIDPGDDQYWGSANGHSIMTDEVLLADSASAEYSEADFRAECSSTAVAAGAASAESIVYREWQVGYNSDSSNPVMKITFDYDISGHLSGFAADAALKGRLWLEDVTSGDYVENFVINKTAMPIDNFNKRVTDTQTFTMEARPGHTYRLHAQGYTKVIALTTSGGQSFFDDTLLMNNWVKVDDVNLQWI